MKFLKNGDFTFTGFLAYYAGLAFIVFVVLFFIDSAHSREKLNLGFSVEVQYRFGDADPWEQSEKRDFEGVGGLQFHLNPQGDYRLILKVQKPFDLEGAFRVRMVTREDGIAVPKGTDFGQIILGPHEGCTGSRCEPLTLSDVGLVELRLDLQKAEETAIGAFTLRPYDDPPPIVIRTRYFHGGNEIHCGSQVKKGWWLFAKKFRADGSLVDTISVCVRRPSGKMNCADDRENHVKVRANEKGTYQFSIWNTKVIENRCEFYAK